MRQIVLDTETTGLRVEEGHRIIEIGCVELINRKLTQNTFHTYLNPLREIDAGAIAIHGITNETVRDKPLFANIANAFLDYIKGAEIIIHNAPFDTGFLDAEILQTHLDWTSLKDYHSIIDTLVMARQMHVGQRNNLDALCKRYGVDNSKRDVHGALVDAKLLANVYLAMTGGQGSFFETTTQSKNSSQTSAKGVVPTAAPVKSALKVVQATAAELAEHEAYVDFMSSDK